MRYLEDLPADAVPVGAEPRSASVSTGNALGMNDLPPDAVPIPEPPSTAPPQPVSTEPTFADKAEQAAKERYERLQRMRTEYMADQISAPEYYASRMATSMGLFFDVAGEGALTVLSAITPDKWEKVFKDAIATGGNKIMSTETAQELLNMWQGADQLTKDRIANTADLAAGIGSQTKVGKALSPTAQTGKKLTASAVKNDKKRLAPIVLDQNMDLRKQRGEEINLEPNKQYQLNHDEDLMTTVLSLPYITGSTSTDGILGAINAGLGQVRTKIKKALKNNPNRIMKSSIYKEVQTNLQKLYQDYPVFLKDKALQNVQKKVLGQLEAVLDGFDGSPAKLLELRQKLDRQIDLTFGDNLYEGNSAARKVVSQVRKALNDLVDQTVDDDDILALLRRQHLLLEARSNTAYARAKEKAAKGVVQKAENIVSRYPYISAGALGITGQQSGLLSNIAPEWLALGGAALAGSAAMQPAVRRTVGEALQAAPVSTSLMYGTANNFPEEEQP